MAKSFPQILALALGISITLTLASRPVRAAATYTLTRIDTTVGFNHANGINTSGQIVGTAGNGYPLPFVWENGNVSYILGDAANSIGRGAAINDLGEVAGVRDGGAYLWSPGGNITSIDADYATAINNLGQVAGDLYPSAGGRHAYVAKAGTVVDLGAPPGTNFSSAFAINDTGEIVGTATFGSQATPPFSRTALSSTSAHCPAAPAARLTTSTLQARSSAEVLSQTKVGALSPSNSGPSWIWAPLLATIPVPHMP